ncbi:hypothetical protein TNCV_957621 [Trichonephila clavipes]|nr:hypothetical protein TNCV_957621 [Trichonephila clavipes]
MVTSSWSACHEFELCGTEGSPPPPCVKGLMHVKFVEAQCPPVDAVCGRCIFEIFALDHVVQNEGWVAISFVTITVLSRRGKQKKGPESVSSYQHFTVYRMVACEFHQGVHVGQRLLTSYSCSSSLSIAKEKKSQSQKDSCVFSSWVSIKDARVGLRDLVFPVDHLQSP